MTRDKLLWMGATMALLGAPLLVAAFVLQDFATLGLSAGLLILASDHVSRWRCRQLETRCDEALGIAERAIANLAAHEDFKNFLAFLKAQPPETRGELVALFNSLTADDAARIVASAREATP